MRINAEISRRLWFRFKAKAAMSEQTVTERLRDLIQRDTEDLPEGTGTTQP